MRRLTLMLVLTFLPPMGVPEAAAEVKLLAALDSNLCYNPQCLGTTAVPVLQGVTTKYKAIGPWTDHSVSATVSGAGITAAVSSPTGNFDNSSIDVALAATGDAAPGERTVTLKNRFGGSTGTFRILVLRKGTIASVDPPSPTSFFTQADVAVSGTNIANSKVDADMPGVSSATLVSNTDAAAVVRLTFSSPQTSVSGKLRFWDKACPTCNIVTRYFHSGGGAAGWIPVTITGPNAIKDITVVTGTATWFIASQPAKVRITLMRPVAANKSIATVSSRVTAGNLSPAGMTVTWQFPESKYVKPASGQVTIPTGQSYAEFTVTPNGEILPGNSAYYQPPRLTIEARTDPHATSAPHLKTASIPFK